MRRRLLLIGIVVATLSGLAIVSSPVAKAELTGPTVIETGDPSGVSPSGLAIGDVTEDGNVDLVWADLGVSRVYVSAGDGDGGFTADSGTVIAGTAVSVALADVDQDDDLDVVVGKSASRNLGLLVNNGDGTFVAEAEFIDDFNTSGAQVVVASLNGDADPDVIRVNFAEGSITRWLGAGGATFGVGATTGVGGLNPWNIAVADLNEDTFIDVIATERAGDNIRFLAGNGDGTFDAAVTVAGPLGGCEPASIDNADFDADGFEDVVFTCMDGDEVRVLLGNGDGTFDALGAFTVADEPAAVRVGDVDDDGVPDIAVAVRGQEGVTVWIGAGDGTFTEDTDSPFGAASDSTSLDSFGSLIAGPNPLAVGDLNGDGCDDIGVTAPSNGEGAVILSTSCGGGGGGGGGGGSSRSPDPSVIRSGGDHRYDTAAMSNDDLPRGIDVAYVTTGEDFPDALATGPVAGIEGAALLLVGRDEIPPETADELTRLRPDRIVVVGGVAAVSRDVSDQLRDLTGSHVRRIAGVDRYETALELSRAAFDASSDVAYLVSGFGFAEALSAGPAAGLEGGPILLVKGATLDDEVAAELERLSPSTIVIAGGSAAVSDELEADVVRRFGAAVVRAGSFNRYSTGVAVAERILDDASETIFISTGEEFADGLAATPWAIREEAPILLVPSDGGLPLRVAALLESHPDADIIVIGGTAAVSERLFDQLEATRSGA